MGGQVVRDVGSPLLGPWLSLVLSLPEAEAEGGIGDPFYCPGLAG